MATYIKTARLNNSDIWNHFLVRDNGDRWIERKDAPEYLTRYLRGYRSPSRNWPKSYFRALQTAKFAAYLTAEDPKLAIELGVAER